MPYTRGLWVSEDDPTYEQCGLCRGAGIVAYCDSPGVIPVAASDRRLRPKQTLFVVSVSVGLTAIVALICIYLIFPRDLGLSVARKIDTLQSYIPPNPPEVPGDPGINITVVDHLIIYNANFLTVTMETAEFDVFYRGSFSGGTLRRNVIIPARGSLLFDIVVSIDDLTRESSKSMFKNCIYFPQMERLEFRLNATISSRRYNIVSGLQIDSAPYLWNTLSVN
eukprot:CFRG8630T1